MPRDRFVIALLAWALCTAAAQAPLGAAASEAGSSPCTCRRQGAWWVATGTNFVVCSLASAAEAQTALDRCERLRGRLNGLLGFPQAAGNWNPRCRVILHRAASGYVAAVGPGSEATVGSSLVSPPRGRIAERRIDLRTDVADYLDAALPHELCHVIVADHYRQQPPPLWYDEGLALLVDPAEKLVRHERDLQAGLRRGAAFSVAELLAADGYPPPERMGVFYGQCASLAQCLWRLGTPAQMHQFVARSQEVGPNLGLRDVYGLDGVPALERRWREEHGAALTRQLALME